MHSLITKLLEKRPVIIDGAWGTMLQKLGLAGGECPDAWNLEHPEAVHSVASAYVNAGSNIILTNTFGANRIRLACFGLSHRTEEINKTGVRISKDAAGDKALVFASIGPTGKMLMLGDITSEELETAFSEQAEALASAGADGLVIETMTDLAEAKIALKAAKKSGLPVVVSMVFDSGKNKDRTMTGTTVATVATSLAEAGADVIGANCGLGIDPYIEVCKQFKNASDLPVWIKPNAGLPEVINNQTCYRTRPEEFAASAIKLFNEGADFIGGCCGTTPEFIRCLKNAFSNL